MKLSVLNTCALAGLQAPNVRCEVHVAPGLPAFHIVGLPDTGVRESRERVRSAILSSGFTFPSGRITANLSPADLPKESGRFDLPIALGILLATGQIQLPNNILTQLAHYYFAAELSLTGALIPIQAPLVLALSIHKNDPNACLVMPLLNAKEAAYVQGLVVFGAQTLAQVVLHLSGQTELKARCRDLKSEEVQHTSACMSDIKGQAFACKALEIAASGGHGLLMIGPPGVGKSMLAHRLPGIMPDLRSEQLIEVMAIHSLVTFSQDIVCATTLQMPFRSPHHSASMVALVGGGSVPKPGEISLAHHGVLFLDELPEFERKALEALREPLETGEICIARSARRQVFPARFQLIAAANPCPCGYLGHLTKACHCSPEQIQRYRTKLSGPLLDRIDLHLQVLPLAENWLQAEAGETSMVIRKRVVDVQQIQMSRQGKLNALLSGNQIKEFCELDAAGQHLLESAIKKFAWSGRSAHRILRVARTIADMRQAALIEAIDLAQAIACRQEQAE